MNSKKTIKKILIALLVAVVFLAAYAFFTNKSDIKTNLSGSSLTSLANSKTTGQIAETNVTLANAEILKILGSIQNIELQDDIFTNPIFKQLKDAQFSIPKPVQVGRTNPFLPIGYDSLASHLPVQQNTNQGLFDSFINNNPGQNDFFTNNPENQAIPNLNEESVRQNTNDLLQLGQ